VLRLLHQTPGNKPHGLLVKESILPRKTQIMHGISLEIARARLPPSQVYPIMPRTHNPGKKRRKIFPAPSFYLLQENRRRTQ